MRPLLQSLNHADPALYYQAGLRSTKVPDSALGNLCGHIHVVGEARGIPACQIRSGRQAHLGRQTRLHRGPTSTSLNPQPRTRSHRFERVYLARRHDFALRAAQGRVVKQAFLLFPSINENVSRLASGVRTMLAAHDGTGRSCRLKLASARCLLNHQTGSLWLGRATH